MKRVSIINGPNLDLLGTRQPEVYGSMTLPELEDAIAVWAAKLGIEALTRQSNDESEIVRWVHDAAGFDGLIINAGGLTHTSVAIADAVASIPTPTVEVHLSDIHRREPFRDVSLIAPNAVFQIVGRGATGYRDALRHLVNRSRMQFETIRYGPHPRNVADHRRSDDARALVVLLHGGYWLPQWERDQLDSVAVDLAERGFDTLNVEYRVDPPWPGSGHDASTAVAMARTLHDRIVLVGHSAGAYLALWHQRRDPAELCICLAPVTDLSMADVPTARAIVAAGGPVRASLEDNTIVFHGADDREVSVGHATRLDDGTGAVDVIPGVGHFDMVDPRKPHWDRVVSALEGRFPT